MLHINKPKYSQDECLKSNNILIYTGFAWLKWNYSYSINNALGGSETAVINLSNNLPEHYNIYVAGNIEEEVVNNTHYIHIDSLVELVKNTAFHTIIVSRYLDFYEKYQNFSAHQTFIWGHDIVLFPYNINMSVESIITKWSSKISGCVCQTNWHCDLFLSLYPQLKDKISIINNGISIDLFTSKSNKNKITNRFIYTSCSERGLNRLLELWPAIVENLPDAELCIASYNPFPNTEDETNMKKIIDVYSNINHLGKLNKSELYDLMATSEYWLYPTNFNETSCITSMEMLMSEVICVYYPLAGLADTVGDYGIRVKRGQEIETIVNLTNKRKTELKKRGREYALSCSWENRAEKWCELLTLSTLNNDVREKIWVFYPGSFIRELVNQYLENLSDSNTKTIISNDIDYINNLNPCEITFLLTPFNLESIPIYSICNFNTKNISFLQLDPLTLPCHLNGITNFFNKRSYLKQYYIYDYSKSNIRILNKNGFENCIHLPYKCTPDELDFLRKSNINDKIYDFGFIYDWRCNNNSKTLPITPPRRNKILEYLIKYGFTVNLIAGYGEDRDSELGKCKIILNIHGQINENPNPSPDECSNIFEHIRCDRLLKAGYSILSETSYDLDEEFISQYSNLKIIKYEDFFNLDVINNALDNVNKENNVFEQPKNYCFIHSCHFKHKGLNRLTNLIDKIKNSGLIHHLEAIYINNIGVPIKENIYGNKFIICNYSDNSALFEIPTINKMLQFSKENTNCNILYLHTKGIRYDDNDEKENDWINMMLYFLVEKFELCLEKMQEGCQAIGCNYLNDPKHFSGNFWWSKSQYISKLPCLIEKTENDNPRDAEFWLCKNNPSIYELHNSNINHYHHIYPPMNYRPLKIIDCFTFYNELDLLKYRLTILNEYVDYFVLVEATHTHVGKEKPIFYQENKNLFEEFNHKIIHIIVDDFSHKYPNINIENDEQWINERFQRNCIKRGLDKLELNDMDVIMITDLDEIPDPKIFKKIKALEIIINVNIIELDFYYYNLNCKMDHHWYYSKMISYKKYKELGLSCDQIRGNMSFEIIKNAGWHLSYFGDEKFIKNKIENFGHQEFNNDTITNEKTIKKIIDSQIDLFGRPNDIIKISIEDNNNLPPKYDIYLKQFYKTTNQNQSIEPNTRKNIAFFIRHFTERGTEVATYDYANYNETLLGNNSYIIHFSDKGQSKYGFPNMKDSFEKFKTRFELIEINDIIDMVNIIRKYKLDFFYTLTHGENDIYQFENKAIWGNCKTIKHCVFNTLYPESDYYISISHQLNKKNSTNIPVIPHMIDLPDVNTNLRNELNIQNNAIVFGRYGAFNLFDLSFTHEAIICFLDVMIDANVYFLFMNTDKFCEHPKIIYLEKNIDLLYKTRFINTCDAMIHASSLGETFGLSIGEFSSRNKPIITCSCGDVNEHIKILGSKAILYESKAQLFNIFLNIREIIKQYDDWNFYKDYTPENVMKIFKNIFDNLQHSHHIDSDIDNVPKNRTICLNMIVKNEAEIIETTLEMLCEKIAFSYWVISDTGSTDNTCENIKHFFKKKNIPGELYNDPWENFAANRSKALKHAFNKSDLVFIFDADDTLCGDICIPDDCSADGYYFTMGGDGIQYNRIMLVNNRIEWVYKSVVHEYIECVGKNEPTIIHILGDYYVKSQRLGSRNNNPDKYLNDAILLSKEYEIALRDNDSLHCRYAFYCANSYRDYGDTENAIMWYKKTLSLDNWSQEKYVCCFQLYKLYGSTNRIELGIYYLIESLQYDIERPECIFYLMMHYVSKNMHGVAYMYYMFIKIFIETKYLDLYAASQLQPFLNAKLFIEYGLYDIQIPYYVILLVHCVGKNAIGGNATIAKMYEIILTRKKLVDIPQYIENVLHNVQFFIAECKEFIPNFTQLFDSYVAFLDENNYIPDDSTEILQKYMADKILTVSCKKKADN